VPERDAAAVRIFPPAVPLVVILLGIGLDGLVPIRLPVELPAPARYWVGGVIAGGAILLLGAWSIVLLRRSGQSENPWSPTTSIVDRGPYRISRNPLYVQMLLVCLGIAVALRNVWIVALTLIAAWLLLRLAILPEEAYLERKFGETYRAYKRRVRRWI
jgi:protein-S-isoprenylcysteine O-methyltransferase Ste14